MMLLKSEIRREVGILRKVPEQTGPMLRRGKNTASIYISADSSIQTS